MILVDTSVWVAHFKSPNGKLIKLLSTDHASCHPLIIAELTCGTPPARSKTLNDLSLLKSSTIATMQEILVFIEQNKLFGKGCGYIDIALLTSALLSYETKIWTLDKRLRKLAQEFHVNYH